ncbi:Uncharacterized membrane protein [Thalassolituus maritimus]|uniref:Uncharacterized membrane protein n=1 Tax=Thalassolituus maritimus TaxID=484498 RepID=A0A1N7IW16_9GAMM|nr:heparan-alpha-glucosaminide N-acetyltransferase domain-containing protein [Thalassolituus maritimus]SIS41234.1 Uncharacterized membrane protein [Thalassolituus maritimus]
MSEQNGRVHIIDFARGTAALLLVIVHALWMYGSVETQFHAPLGTAIHIVGQMTAAFLLCMGFSFVITRHSSIGYGIKRALMILAAGYLLNTLKFIVPISVFGTMPENFIEAYGWSSPLDSSQLWYLFRTGDILQFAGIAFLIITFVRHYISNKWVILALALLSVLVAEVIRGYRPGITGLDYVADLLWGDQWNVYFPVFPWISNILVGMFMGMVFLERDKDEQAVYDMSLKLGVGLMAIGVPLILYDWDLFFRNFFHTGIGGAIYLIGINLFAFWCVSWMIFKPLKSKAWFMNSMVYLSQRVTTIYIIQWTLVCWLMGIIGYQTLNSGQLLMLFPFMIAATLLLDYLLKKLIDSFSADKSDEQPRDSEKVA